LLAVFEVKDQPALAAAETGLELQLLHNVLEADSFLVPFDEKFQVMGCRRFIDRAGYQEGTPEVSDPATLVRRHPVPGGQPGL
jgi:hypothetical protein